MVVKSNNLITFDDYQSLISICGYVWCISMNVFLYLWLKSKNEFEIFRRIDVIDQSKQTISHLI